MAYDVERRPAGWVSRQAARHEILFWTAGLSMLAACAVVVVVEHDHPGQRIGAVSALALVLLFVALRPHAVQWADTVLDWRKGAVAERAVGELLSELGREGWIVMHDLAQDGRGNIDHLISGPNGVYLVETKYRRYADRDLPKVKWRAARLNREVGVWVTPVICLFDRSGNPFHAGGVAVIPRQHLLEWLHAQRSRPADFERLARFAETC